MVFSILDHERLKWRKVRMRPADVTWIEEASKVLARHALAFIDTVVDQRLV